MTKRILNNNELEIITGGATEIAEDGSGPATSKAEAPMTGSAEATAPTAASTPRSSARTTTCKQDASDSPATGAAGKPAALVRLWRLLFSSARRIAGRFEKVCERSQRG